MSASRTFFSARSALAAGRAFCAAAALAGALLGLGAPQALAQFPGGGLSGAPDPGVPLDDRRNRVTVTVRTVPVGAFCLRVVEAVGFDGRLNQRLYRVRFDSGVLTSLGAVAYENALSSARTEQDALRGLAAAERDAAPYRRSPDRCS